MMKMMNNAENNSNFNSSDMIFPAIAAAASIGGSLISNAGAKRRERDAREYNLEMWRRNNEYNHPSAQMSRLREAGLNPNMIYGTSPTSAVGNAGSAPQPGKAAPYEMNIGNPVADIAAGYQMRNTAAQTDNFRTQNSVLAQEAALKSAQRAGTLINNARSGLDYEIAKELKNTSLDAARENLRVLKQQTIGRELDNYFNDKTMSDRVQKVILDIQVAKETLKGQKLDNAMRKYDTELMKMGINKNDPIYFRFINRIINDIPNSPVGKDLFDYRESRKGKGFSNPFN